MCGDERPLGLSRLAGFVVLEALFVVKQDNEDVADEYVMDTVLHARPKPGLLYLGHSSCPNFQGMAGFCRVCKRATRLPAA